MIRQSTPATLAIVLFNILVFIGLNTIPNLSEMLLLNSELNLIAMRPWTLFTVFFSHEVLIHLLGTMSLFWFFGKELEKISNSKFVVLTYVISGFVGTLTFPLFASLIGWSGPVVGASAAVFGIVAAYGGIRPNISLLGSKVYQWVIALFIFNAIWFIANPAKSVGAAAHVAGLLVGWACGFWFKKKDVTKEEAL